MPENDHRPDDGAGQDSDGELVEDPDERAVEDVVDAPDDEQDALPQESDDPLTGAVPDEGAIPAPPAGGDDLAPGEAVQQLVPELEKTGHEAVDAALATLDGLASTSVDEHVAMFEATHEELRRVLNEAADAQQPPPA